MLWTSVEQQFDLAPKHEDGEGDQKQSRDRLWQVLIILGQPPKPAHPGKLALDHPAPGGP